MKRYLYIAVAALVVILTAVVVVQSKRVQRIRAERDRYATNTATLLSDFETYKTATEQLNAAKVGELRLKLSEYERYRAEDMQTISTLNIKIRDLQRVMTSQSATIIDLQTRARDTIIYLAPDAPDTVKHISVGDEWYNLDGFLEPNMTFSAKIEVRDSIYFTETVQYKRFLGFLWKTKKVKRREYDIVNRNPYTTILGFEVVSIEK